MTVPEMESKALHYVQREAGFINGAEEKRRRNACKCGCDGVQILIMQKDLGMSKHLHRLLPMYQHMTIIPCGIN